VKLGKSDLHEIPLKTFEFHENLCSENRTLLKIINKILPISLHFSSDLDKIRCQKCPQNYFSKCEFHENLLSESHTLLRGVNEFSRTFQIYCPSCLKFRVRYFNVMLFSICEFRINRCSEGRTFLMGLNETTYCRLYRESV
jgi:hypothetical protein